MPTKKKAAPPRAKRGSTPRRLLLALPAELDDAARAAARAEGITTAEWWRLAGRDRLATRARTLVGSDRERGR